MARYEFSEGKSNKFWEIVLDGPSFTTTYGRIGATGQSSTKSFPNEAKARAAHDALIAEKVKKGYQPVDAGPAPSPRKNVVAASPAKNEVARPTAIAEQEDAGASTRKRVVEKTAPVAVDEAPAEAAPATPSSTPPAQVDTPRFDWTAEAEKKGRKHSKPLEVVPRRAPAPAVAWKDIHGCFTSFIQSELEQGVPRMTALRDLQNEVIWKWGASTPPTTLDARTEAAALVLFPISTRFGALQAMEELPETLIDFWVGFSGLPFAIEVFVSSLSLPGLENSWRPAARWLSPGTERGLAGLLRGRPDRTLRAHLASTAPEARDEAHARATALRGRGDLLTRSALSAVFLEPEWIEADLRERIETGRRALVTPEMLVAAPSVATLGNFFASLTEDELHYFRTPSKWEESTASLPWALLKHRREDAVVPLTRWLRRCVEVGEPARWPPTRWDTINALWDVLSLASGYPEIAEAACSVLLACEGLKLAKSDDPRPAAHAWLRRSAKVAFPIVREMAKKKATSSTKELLAQLERLAEGPKRTAPEATPDELPDVLRKGLTWKAPGFWLPESFTVPLTRSGKALPREAIEHLGGLLAAREPDALARLRESLGPEPAAAFAWDLFQAWLTAGSPVKEKWAFLALGTLGSDETARKLTPLIRAWPGESAHQRAVMGLDVLAEIGTDVALMMLDGIARKVKFKGLQERARQKMDEIAARRGLDPEALADRLVPDLDLEDDGSKVLDFGPRSFRVGFDENLEPFVMDASGARLKALPKPGVKDDPTLSAEAVETWKAMKKDARAVASVQLLRLELAMGAERRWSPEELHGFLISHPLLIHVVRRLVWGVFDEAGALTSTFRVAEDRSLAGIEDETFALDPSARVGIVHPLRASEATLSRWKQIFADYEIIQPFEQLNRQVWRLEVGEKASTSLERFSGREVETKKVMGLLGRGWFRGPAYDNGIVPYFIKRVAGEVTAAIQIDPGMCIGAMEYTDRAQELGTVDFGTDEPDWGGVRANALSLSEVPEPIMSEIIRDLESLGLASDENEAP